MALFKGNLKVWKSTVQGMELYKKVELLKVTDVLNSQFIFSLAFISSSLFIVIHKSLLSAIRLNRRHVSSTSPSVCMHLFVYLVRGLFCSPLLRGSNPKVTSV